MSETKKKTFAVLTSGGDAPGMNAAVRSVVRTALHKGHSVYGIFHGYEGLMEDHMDELQERSVSNIINRGGTILYTARSKEFMTEEGQKKAAAILRSRGIDGLVVIGGDGSFRGAQKLSALGIPTIGIPGTIDNDIASTEYTIGFDTALNTAVQSIDKLRDTSQSHDRCSVVEVMGRNAGHLALYAGLATGAVATLIPERPFDLDRDVVDRMKATMTTGKHHFIVVVAEGVGNSKDMCYYIQAAHRRGDPPDGAGPCAARRRRHSHGTGLCQRHGLPCHRAAGRRRGQPHCRGQGKPYLRYRH